MDFCSQIVRNVEIPASLSDFSKLTKIKGGVILKDAAAENGGLRVEGDLYWEGYVASESGIDECAWEGAEYFVDHLNAAELRFRDPFMLEPEVMEVTAAADDEKNCTMTFSIRWWEEERQNEEKESFEKELAEINENFRETVSEFTEAGIRDDLIPNKEPIKTEEDFSEKENQTFSGMENKITEICNDFRELRKKEAPLTKEVYQTEIAEELVSDSNQYCIRYYRASDDDTLESIANRFSVSLAKMRRVNELDEVGLISGRLVRIPR